MNRTQALCKALGWQGGTIHQISDETNCSVNDLLYGSPNKSSQNYTSGWFAGRTCSLEHNQMINFPKHKGDLNFWLGVADGLILNSIPR